MRERILNEAARTAAEEDAVMDPAQYKQRQQRGDQFEDDDESVDLTRFGARGAKQTQQRPPSDQEEDEEDEDEALL